MWIALFTCCLARHLLSRKTVQFKFASKEKLSWYTPWRRCFVSPKLLKCLWLYKSGISVYTGLCPANLILIYVLVHIGPTQSDFTLNWYWIYDFYKKNGSSQKSMRMESNIEPIMPVTMNIRIIEIHKIANNKSFWKIHLFHWNTMFTLLFPVYVKKSKYVVCWHADPLCYFNSMKSSRHTSLFSQDMLLIHLTRAQQDS